MMPILNNWNCEVCWPHGCWKVQSSDLAVLSLDYGGREAPSRIVDDSSWEFDRAYSIKLDLACPSWLQLAVGK